MIPLRDDTRRSRTPVVNLLLIAANALGGVAFFAHIGGFVAGPLLLLLLGGGRRPARRSEIGY